MKRTERGVLKFFSVESGIKINHLSDYVHKRRGRSEARLIHLEDTTGVPMSIWAKGSVADIKKALEEQYALKNAATPHE